MGHIETVFGELSYTRLVTALLQPFRGERHLATRHQAGHVVQEDKQLVSKSMDCLRILTTGNEANKEALFQIPSSLSTLMKRMSPDGDLVQLITQ